MIVFDIPGRGTISIENVLLDYNGAIAKDGVMSDRVRSLIERLAEEVTVAVLTADTHGNVRRQCEGLNVHVETFTGEHGDECKGAYARSLQGGVACLGNGTIDVKMFDESDLAIAVMDAEGVCAKLIAHADILTRSIEEALELLLIPHRVRATLRV